MELSRVTEGRCRLWAKAEFLNLGGSVKSRTALGLITDARDRGALSPGDAVVEASSGNEGVALAMLAAAYGYRAVIVMPADLPPERQRIIEHFGGEVVLVEPRASIRETMRACQEVAAELGDRPGYYYCRQFDNPANPAVHERTTGAEILAQVAGRIDAVVVAVGTGGTLTGVARAVRRVHPQVRVVAVEPATAAVLSGGPVTTHHQYGIGEGFVPGVLDRSLIDEVVTVTDQEAYAMARRLAREEGLLVGITSGTNVVASCQMAQRLAPGSTVVTLLPDGGERYLSDRGFVTGRLGAGG